MNAAELYGQITLIIGVALMGAALIKRVLL